MDLSFRLEYKGSGPFASSECFSELRDKIILHADSDIDKFGTTFLNYYDQAMSAGLNCNPELKGLLETHPRGVLQFGFISRQDMSEHFGLDIPGRYLKQFMKVLNAVPELLIRVYEVRPICFHNHGKEVIYLSIDSELVAEANTYQEFLRL